MKISINELLFRVILLCYCSVFFINSLNSFIKTINYSSLLYTIFQGTIILIVIARKIPHKVSGHIIDWFIAILGVALPLAILPQANGQDNILLLSLQIFGLIITYCGLVSLNTSFGVVAANRGIKKNGILKFIRHPMYLGYLLTTASFTIQHFSKINLLVFGTFLIVTIIRITREEKLLLEDTEYKNLCTQTKWRLVPYIW